MNLAPGTYSVIIPFPSDTDFRYWLNQTGSQVLSYRPVVPGEAEHTWQFRAIRYFFKVNETSAWTYLGASAPKPVDPNAIPPTIEPNFEPVPNAPPLPKDAVQTPAGPAFNPEVSGKGAGLFLFGTFAILFIGTKLLRGGKKH